MNKAGAFQVRFLPTRGSQSSRYDRLMRPLSCNGKAYTLPTSGTDHVGPSKRRSLCKTLKSRNCQATILIQISCPNVRHTKFRTQVLRITLHEHTKPCCPQAITRSTFGITCSLKSSGSGNCTRRIRQPQRQCRPLSLTSWLIRSDCDIMLGYLSLRAQPRRNPRP